MDSFRSLRRGVLPDEPKERLHGRPTIDNHFRGLSSVVNLKTRASNLINFTPLAEYCEATF